MQTIAEALNVLELGPQATPQEVEEGYRNLAKVWHPDRFMNDEKLRIVAEKRIKAINKAYEYLRERSSSANATSRDDFPRSRPADVEREVYPGSPATVVLKKSWDAEFEYDPRKVFNSSVPWNHQIGWFFGMAAIVLMLLGMFGFVLGLGEFHEPGKFYAVQILFSSFPVLGVMHLFGYPKRMKAPFRQTGDIVQNEGGGHVGWRRHGQRA